jgi:hypothetical protein
MSRVRTRSSGDKRTPVITWEARERVMWDGGNLDGGKGYAWMAGSGVNMLNRKVCTLACTRGVKVSSTVDVSCAVRIK